jgi:hypothetical protein
MTDVQVAETEKRVRRSAEIVEEDYDALPDATRAGRTSQLRLKINKVKEDNTGKHRLIARYHSSASASSAATAQRKEFAGQGFKFIVRPLEGEFKGMTGLFVIWNEAWVGADDAPKPRKRKAAEVAETPAQETAEEVVASRRRK